MAKNTKDQVIAFRIYRNLSVLAGVMLLTLSGLVYWGHSFASNMVHDELSAQRIYFPEAGSPGFSKEDYPHIQKYAGQLVDSGTKAQAYANDYIGKHLENSGGGKTYAEISTLARQNPTDEKLQELRTTMLQGETLRGILLGTGYAFGLIGTIAGIAAAALLIAGLGLLALTAYFHIRIKR